MGKIVIANFNQGEKSARVTGLTQYDYGAVLRIQGLNLPPAVEIQFSLQETGGEAPSCIGTTKDGVTDVVIPDDMLENSDTIREYYIYAWIYLRNETSGETIRKIIMRVNSRSKPTDYTAPDPERDSIFQEAITAVNESAERAETAEKSAEGWAHGHEDYPERDEDNAKYYAGQAKDIVAEIPGQVEDAKKHIDGYVSGKEHELKGDTGNVYFAAFKVVNGRLKMYSDPEIDKVRFVRIGSRLKYRLAM